MQRSAAESFAFQSTKNKLNNVMFFKNRTIPSMSILTVSKVEFTPQNRGGNEKHEKSVTCLGLLLAAASLHADDNQAKPARQPVNVGLQFYGNAVHPPGASSWTVRMQIAFLFPTGAKRK